LENATLHEEVERQKASVASQEAIILELKAAYESTLETMNHGITDKVSNFRNCFLFHWMFIQKAMEERILDNNAGKQLS
jgi:hypothetical protein